MDRRIAEEGGTKYDFQYETPDRLIPPDEVQTTIRALRRAFQSMVRKEFSRLSADDAVKLQAIQTGKEVAEVVRSRMPKEQDLRERIVATSPVFREFAQSNQNKKMFESVCSFSLTQERFQEMLDLCTLRDVVNKKILTEENGKAIVSQHIQRKAAIEGLTAKSKTETDPEELEKVMSDLQRVLETPDPLRYVAEQRKAGKM